MDDNGSTVQDEADLDTARRLLARMSIGAPSQLLPFGKALAEFDDWLTDDRQWLQGGPGHWAALIEDLRRSLDVLVSMSCPPTQESLANHAEDLGRLRKSLVESREAPDIAVRQELRRVGVAMRADVLEKRLVSTAWRRLIDWFGSGSDRVELGIHALRDLIEMHGHVAKDLFTYVDGVLSDKAVYVAFARGERASADRDAPAGESARERLELSDRLLERTASEASGVVWLEYEHARLWSPGILPLGNAATLYDADLLRGLLESKPDDPRIPEDLRDRAEADFSELWFRNESREEDPAEPRVFLRLKFPPMPIPSVTSLARETAEFLVALGDPDCSTPDMWLLGDSYMVRGWQQSHSAPTARARLAEHESRRDAVALRISRQADDLASHLPLQTHRLRAAARLLVWLRQASATSAPATVVLCDRVVEQVCGWAGVAEFSRFTDEYLKPEWTYIQIWNAVLIAFWRLRDSPFGKGVLPEATEPAGTRPPHAPPNYWPSTNLKVILENLDRLIAVAPGTDPAQPLERLKGRLNDSKAINAWLKELGRTFDQQNKRLRRTRNALVHGGPLAPATVEHISNFSLGLAHLAVRPAIDLLLADRDLVDGFLDRQAAQRKCFAQLRNGVPASDALFWDPSI